MDHEGRAILAKNLKGLRSLHAMTQEDLAGAAQIDRTYLSLVENKRYAATVDMLDKIAPVFDLRIDEMLQIDIVDIERVRRGK